MRDPRYTIGSPPLAGGTAKDVIQLQQRIRFVTYNIRKGKGASGFARGCVADLGHALAPFYPDLVLCQEVSHLYEPAESQSAELGSILGLRSYYQPNKRRRDGHHGNATFTRHRVSLARNYDISTNRLERRGALYVRLEVGPRPLHVLNAHLGLNQVQRFTQVRRLAGILLEHVSPQDPVVLAGDFNDWNRRLERIIVDELGFVNALSDLPEEETRTWHALRPVFNLDRVYVRNVRAASARRLRGHPWEELSDHLPLLVELDLTALPLAA
jgi:endonuclease/exonuclease/phosphatase family metal-dependent hydrolase